MVNFKHDAIVTTNEMDELVECLAMSIDGHDVQVLRFNGDNEKLLVKIDRSINKLSIDEVDDFIRGRLAG